MFGYFHKKSSIFAVIAVCLAGRFAGAQASIHPADSASARSGVAAVVDGHTISIDEIEKIAIRRHGQEILDTLIDNYLVDREGERLHIEVSEAEIDKQVEALTEAIKPETLEEGLRDHHQTLAEVRDDIRHRLLAVKLAAMSAPAGHFVHARVICISSGSGKPAGTDVYEQFAAIRKQLLDGAKFEDLASQYNSDAAGRKRGGDIGILFDGAPFDVRVVQAALELKPGMIAEKPVETPSGDYLVMVTSTDSDHRASENQLYSDAEKQYRMVQGSRNLPSYIEELRSKATITQFLHP